MLILFQAHLTFLSWNTEGFEEYPHRSSNEFIKGLSLKLLNKKEHHKTWSWLVHHIGLNLKCFNDERNMDILLHKMFINGLEACGLLVD